MKPNLRFVRASIVDLPRNEYTVWTSSPELIFNDRSGDIGRNATTVVLQEQTNAASAIAASANDRVVLILPVPARRSERRRFKKPSFVDHAAKVTREPNLQDLRSATNVCIGRIWI